MSGICLKSVVKVINLNSIKTPMAHTFLYELAKEYKSDYALVLVKQPPDMQRYHKEFGSTNV